ncbi:MAG: tRNA (adenosine(37)-N6)-threonylcarbamoyltransferase complex transferase subunit TsaD [Planctomycetota bacterium]|jgi:N6-L-threonylcarbamoyladenine synthase
MSTLPVVLGIESSCDETAAAVVVGGRHVRSNVVATQHELHERYAGVVPEIASRAHLERILPVVDAAVAEAGVTLEAIDAVAVGHRPGLIGSLLVGTAAAKALAWSLQRPLVPVDHVHAHLAAGLLEAEPPSMPAVGLVVSGGHTSLFEVAAPFEPRTIGRTIDDAIGEAYDKAATILGLGYPGGPAVDAAAARGDERAMNLPVARLGGDRPDFSFSGLKTALRYAVTGPPVGRGAEARTERSLADLSPERIDDLAASFQRAAVTAVMRGLRRALDERPAVRTVLVGGGVSANSRLRRELTALAEERSLDLRLPPMAWCLDNAAMIAGLGAIRLAEGRTADLSLSASPRPTG